METTNPTSPNTHKKLPRLPRNFRINKRPLTHPPIPSPYTASSTASPRTIYISPHTPFVSALKRTRKLLAEIDKRSHGKVNLVDSKASDRERLRATARRDKGREKGTEEVVLKGTGKAIERVLGLAIFLQREEDLRVWVRTGTVGVVDDVVVRERRVGGGGKGRGGEKGGKEHEEEGGERGGKEKEEGQDVPESWVRKASMVEVVVTLR